MLLFDVDGVLTDGRVTIHADGTESKSFGIRDGIAMVWAQRAGISLTSFPIRFGFLSKVKGCVKNTGSSTVTVHFKVSGPVF